MTGDLPDALALPAGPPWLTAMTMIPGHIVSMPPKRRCAWIHRKLPPFDLGERERGPWVPFDRSHHAEVNLLLYLKLCARHRPLPLLERAGAAIRDETRVRRMHSAYRHRSRRRT